ncbi:uncharacterized protein LOC122788325 [Protopterus annectens]|uniref:uncharacterized protein LOC122788325 n=1 Tax=Protopterus annectens TaxID=7888 RepID=UPI001CFA5903|nr:uncharacterized protein LOC122788325 [Protopterus annectens]
MVFLKSNGHFLLEKDMSSATENEEMACTPSSSVPKSTKREVPVQKVLCFPRPNLLAKGLRFRNHKKHFLYSSRRKREFIPEERKDATYWDKRRKNNEAAKRSREKRRINDIVMEERLMSLMQENAQLKTELMAHKIQFHRLQDPSQCHILCNIPHSPFINNYCDFRFAESLIGNGLSADLEPFHNMHLYNSAFISREASSSSRENVLLYPLEPIYRTHTLQRDKQTIQEKTEHNLETNLLGSIEVCHMGNDSPHQMDSIKVQPSTITEPKILPQKFRIKTVANGHQEPQEDRHYSQVTSTEGTSEDHHINVPKWLIAPSMPSQTSAFNMLLPRVGHNHPLLKTNLTFPWGAPNISPSTPAYPEAPLYLPLSGNSNAKALDRNTGLSVSLQGRDIFKNKQNNLSS